MQEYANFTIEVFKEAELIRKIVKEYFANNNIELDLYCKKGIIRNENTIFMNYFDFEGFFQALSKYIVEKAKNSEFEGSARHTTDDNSWVTEVSFAYINGELKVSEEEYEETDEDDYVDPISDEINAMEEARAEIDDKTIEEIKIILESLSDSDIKNISDQLGIYTHESIGIKSIVDKLDWIVSSYSFYKRDCISDEEEPSLRKFFEKYYHVKI